MNGNGINNYNSTSNRSTRSGLGQGNTSTTLVKKPSAFQSIRTRFLSFQKNITGKKKTTAGPGGTANGHNSNGGNEDDDMNMGNGFADGSMAGSPEFNGGDGNNSSFYMNQLSGIQRNADMCVGIHYLWFEYIDQRGSKWYLHDASGWIEKEAPEQVTICYGELDKNDMQGLKRRAYYRSMNRRQVDVDSEIKHKKMLSVCHPLQEARRDAYKFGDKELMSNRIHSVGDILEIAQLQHHTERFEEEGVDIVSIFFLSKLDLEELGLKMGESILLNIILEKIRRVKVSEEHREVIVKKAKAVPLKAPPPKSSASPSASATSASITKSSSPSRTSGLKEEKQRRGSSVFALGAGVAAAAAAVAVTATGVAMFASRKDKDGETTPRSGSPVPNANEISTTATANNNSSSGPPPPILPTSIDTALTVESTGQSNESTRVPETPSGTSDRDEVASQESEMSRLARPLPRPVSVSGGGSILGIGTARGSLLSRASIDREDLSARGQSKDFTNDYDDRTEDFGSVSGRGPLPVPFTPSNRSDAGDDFRSKSSEFPNDEDNEQLDGSNGVPPPIPRPSKSHLSDDDSDDDDDDDDEDDNIRRPPPPRAPSQESNREQSTNESPRILITEEQQTQEVREIDNDNISGSAGTKSVAIAAAVASAAAIAGYGLARSMKDKDDEDEKKETVEEAKNDEILASEENEKKVEQKEEVKPIEVEGSQRKSSHFLSEILLRGASKREKEAEYTAIQETAPSEEAVETANVADEPEKKEIKRPSLLFLEEIKQRKTGEGNEDHYAAYEVEMSKEESDHDIQTEVDESASLMPLPQKSADLKKANQLMLAQIFRGGVGKKKVETEENSKDNQTEADNELKEESSLYEQEEIANSSPGLGLERVKSLQIDEPIDTIDNQVYQNGDIGADMDSNKIEALEAEPPAYEESASLMPSPQQSFEAKKANQMMLAEILRGGLGKKQMQNLETEETSKEKEIAVDENDKYQTNTLLAATVEHEALKDDPILHEEQTTEEATVPNPEPALERVKSLEIYEPIDVVDEHYNIPPPAEEIQIEKPIEIPLDIPVDDAVGVSTAPVDDESILRVDTLKIDNVDEFTVQEDILNDPPVYEHVEEAAPKEDIFVPEILPVEVHRVESIHMIDLENMDQDIQDSQDALNKEILGNSESHGESAQHNVESIETMQMEETHVAPIENIDHMKDLSTSAMMKHVIPHQEDDDMKSKKVRENEIADNNSHLLPVEEEALYEHREESMLNIEPDIDVKNEFNEHIHVEHIDMDVAPTNYEVQQIEPMEIVTLETFNIQDESETAFDLSKMEATHNDSTNHVETVHGHNEKVEEMEIMPMEEMVVEVDTGNEPDMNQHQISDANSVKIEEQSEHLTTPMKEPDDFKPLTIEKFMSHDVNLAMDEDESLYLNNAEMIEGASLTMMGIDEDDDESDNVRSVRGSTLASFGNTSMFDANSSSSSAAAAPGSGIGGASPRSRISSNFHTPSASISSNAAVASLLSDQKRRISQTSQNGKTS